MRDSYEKGIYDELGYEIAQQLKNMDCQFRVNLETLKFTFINCPQSLVNKILEIKKIKGERSILNEFVPSQIFMASTPHTSKSNL